MMNHFDDLFAEANFGYFMGLLKFNKKENPDIKINTYVFHWVRQAVDEYIKKNKKNVKFLTTEGKRRASAAFGRNEAKFKDSDGNFDLKKMSEELFISEDVLREVQDALLKGAEISLNSSETEDGDGPQLELKSSSPGPEWLLSREEGRRILSEKITEFISGYGPGVAKDIIENRLMSLLTLGEEKMTLEEIGVKNKINNKPLPKQRVKQIEDELKDLFKKKLGTVSAELKPLLRDWR